MGNLLAKTIEKQNRKSLAWNLRNSRNFIFFVYFFQKKKRPINHQTRIDLAMTFLNFFFFGKISRVWNVTFEIIVCFEQWSRKHFSSDKAGGIIPTHLFSHSIPIPILITMFFFCLCASSSSKFLRFVSLSIFRKVIANVYTSS